MASETGVLPVKPEEVLLKGRLAPGRMFLVDTERGRIIPDEEIKRELAARRPYAAVGEGKPDPDEAIARSPTRAAHRPSTPS